MIVRRVLPLIAAAAWCFGATPAAAQGAGKGSGTTPPDRPPSSTPGRSPGRFQPVGRVYLYETAPDFELEGSQGRSVKLSSLRGDWVLLVFQPYMERLEFLQPHVEKMTRQGVRMVGICGEKQYQVAGYARKRNLEFLMLADVTRDVAAMYGLFDPVTRNIRPGAFLLDPRGTVQLMVLGQVPSPDELVSVTIPAPTP